MRICDMISKTGKFISLEFFPPQDKTSWPAFFSTVEKLQAINPLFVSVTYGAGGSTQDSSLNIVSRLRKDFGLIPLGHLTCVGAHGKRLHHFLETCIENDVHNVLALRGDPPKGQTTWVPDSEKFHYASDLVRFIRSSFPQIGIAVAAYPEGHEECPTIREDLGFLKNKLELSDMAITQLFFDNRLYWNFVERMQDMQVAKPLIPGVLPIMSLQSAKRVLSLCGASIPGKFLLELEKADSEGGAQAAYAVGMRWAKKQVQELLEGGAPGVHLYTLNRDRACLELVKSLDPELFNPTAT